MAPKRKQVVPPSDHEDVPPQYFDQAKATCQNKLEETAEKIQHKRARTGEKIVNKAVEHRKHLEQYLEKTQLNVANISDSMSNEDKQFSQLLKKVENVRSKLSSIDKRAAELTAYTAKYIKDSKKEFLALLES